MSDSTREGAHAAGAPVRRIGFAYNPTIEAATELRERAAGWLEMQGLTHWASAAADRETLHRELPGTDVLIVLGGDGTFLRAARAVIDDDVPLLGINVGKVGFLSKVEANELERVLGQLVAGDYGLESRMVLEGRIIRGGEGAAESAAAASSASSAASALDLHPALNDIVVARGSLARVVRVEVSIDGSHVATFVADGLVVASPTGSTGYSFSAGGPILDPTARNLVVTPIAGYLTTIRSVVVGPSAVVRCRILDALEALVSVDGREDLPIRVGDVVEVRAIDRPIRFVEPAGSLPFWDLLRHKVELLPS
ncbi:MAG TPA: NAD(+)/NADH kinase [Candidatus Limnocylindrales bacterium]|nr:NAD(+)/NADH kinase [Candidatus Limnocylindrales bacterium]